VSGWAAYGGQSQVLTTRRDGGDARVLGQEGDVQALTWESALPGGDTAMNCVLSMGSRYRTPAVSPGRLVEVHRGGLAWRGTMMEPAPNEAGGWAVTAIGEGSYGNNLRAIDGGGAGGQGGTPASCDAMVQGAINRGLRWYKPFLLDLVPGIDTTQLYEKGSRSVTEALNAFCDGGTLTWQVSHRPGNLLRGSSVGQIDVIQLPSIYEPTRLLVTADPAARTLAGYYTAMVLRYQTSANDAATASYDVAQLRVPWLVDRYGQIEGYADYSNGGYMSGPQALIKAGSVLGAYQATSYSQGFTATPGMVLTLGGSPVDLGTERAGEVYRVIFSDFGAGGEVNSADPVTFLAGGYVWDDIAQAARITPYQFIANDFSSLVSQMAPPPVMPNLGLVRQRNALG
jgi:hypothetical protein